MSLLQAIVSATTSGSAPPPAPYYNVYRSGGMNEGISVSVIFDYANLPSQTIYWEIVGDSVNYPSQQATPSADLISDSGFSGTVTLSGSGTTTLAGLTNVGDGLLEGVEYYAVKLGTSAGASDIGYYGGLNINDTSHPGTGTPDTGSWAGITYTLTPHTNGTGDPGTANPGDTITWTITSSPTDTSGRTMYWWVDNNDVPAYSWVENTNNGTFTLDGNGTGTFSLTVANPTQQQSKQLFRMYVGMSLYQGFVTHGTINIT